MSEGCNHDCSSCSEKCSEKTNPADFIEKPHELSNINKVIAIVSGKGGVGKSLITGLCSVASRRIGYNTAILDADITGPSIPKMFNLKEKAMGNESGIFPVKTSTGIEVMSLNLLTENETDPVIWRGPVLGGTVKQFWTDVIWGNVDFMFIDMPPGTGDVPLTVFQSIPIDGIIVVTSPQDLVSMIVGKAVNMAKMMNIPILGLVENMSYIQCTDCGKKMSVFGESQIKKVAQEYDLNIISRIPIDPKLAAACDAGTLELTNAGFIDEISELLDRIKNQKDQ